MCQAPFTSIIAFDQEPGVAYENLDVQLARPRPALDPIRGLPTLAYTLVTARSIICRRYMLLAVNPKL